MTHNSERGEPKISKFKGTLSTIKYFDIEDDEPSSLGKDNNMPEDKKSDCCNYKMIVDSSDEGTNFYRCVKCGEPCDAMESSK